MNKLFSIGIVFGLMIIVYLLLAVMSPIYADLTSQAVSDIEASANTSLFPGVVEGVGAFPFYMWAIPGIIAIIVIVIIIKRKDRG